MTASSEYDLPLSAFFNIVPRQELMLDIPNRVRAVVLRVQRHVEGAKGELPQCLRRRHEIPCSLDLLEQFERQRLLGLVVAADGQQRRCNIQMK